MASEFSEDAVGILDVVSPLKCSCQDLLKSSQVRLSGWLRKKCMRNRLSIKIFKWPCVFIVVCNKCIYFFKNETAERASGSASLFGFNRVIRSVQDQSSDTPWAFKLEHIQPEFRSLYFSATSEKEMLKWMKAIKSEMLVANNKEPASSASYIPHSDSMSSVSSSSWDSADYNDLESSIYVEPEDVEEVKRVSTVTIAGTEDEDFEDDVFANKSASNSALATILKTSVSPQKSNNRRALPRTPSQSGASDDYQLQQATSDETSFWTAIHFSGNKVEAASVISDIAETGVFLVRKSEDDSFVLVVNANGCRKYKIYSKEDGDICLQTSGPKFPNLELLVYHYCHNNLPNIDVKLKTPYKMHPKYKSS